MQEAYKRGFLAAIMPKLALRKDALKRLSGQEKRAYNEGFFDAYQKLADPQAGVSAGDGAAPEDDNTFDMPPPREVPDEGQSSATTFPAVPAETVPTSQSEERQMTKEEEEKGKAHLAKIQAMFDGIRRSSLAQNDPREHGHEEEYDPIPF